MICTDGGGLEDNIPRNRQGGFCCQALPPLRRPQREDCRHVRPRHEHARHQRVPARAIRRAGQAWVRELLGDGLQRTEGARSGRHPERRHGRHQGHDASPGDRLPEDGDNAVLLFADLAQHLGAGGAVLPLPVGGTQAHLNDELD